MNLSTVLAALVLFSSIPAFAETDAAESAATADPGASVSPLAHRFALELTATMSGSIGANTKVVEGSAMPLYVSDGNLAIGARRFLSERIAIGLSFDLVADINDGGRDPDGQRETYDAQEVFIHPALLGFRYQFASLDGSATLRPFVEVGLGPTYATTLTGGPESHRSTTAYFSARATVGVDAFFTRATRAYVGARGGYLAVSHPALSNLQSSLMLGYLF